MILEPQVLVRAAVEAAEEKKAEDIVVLNIRPVSIIADYFVICSGRSTIHTQSIAEEIENKLSELGVKPRKEGFREGGWILLDCGSVVIHVFLEAERRFYNLERLWGDAPVIEQPLSI